MTKNWRVDFKSPIGERGKRKEKVFTWTLAETPEQAAANIMKHHPGSEIVKVEEQKR